MRVPWQRWSNACVQKDIQSTGRTWKRTVYILQCDLGYFIHKDVYVCLCMCVCVCVCMCVYMFLHSSMMRPGGSLSSDGLDFHPLVTGNHWTLLRKEVIWSNLSSRTIPLGLVFKMKEEERGENELSQGAVAIVWTLKGRMGDIDNMGSFMDHSVSFWLVPGSSLMKTWVAWETG